MSDAESRATVAAQAIELLRTISDRGPWIEICQWCRAYWGERFPAGLPSYVSQDPHDPDCLWLKVESVVAQLGRDV